MNAASCPSPLIPSLWLLLMPISLHFISQSRASSASSLSPPTHTYMHTNKRKRKPTGETFPGLNCLVLHRFQICEYLHVRLHLLFQSPSNPSLSVPNSLKNSPWTTAAPWTPMLYPDDLGDPCSSPCAKIFWSMPQLHSEKKQRVPSSIRGEFCKYVYTIRQVHRTVPSNSVNHFPIPIAHLPNITRVISYTS